MSDLEAPLSRGSGPIHRLDPRARLLALLVFSLPVALVHSQASALAALGFGLLALALARPAPGLVLRRLLAVNAFTAFLWVFLPLDGQGEALFRLGPLAYSHEGTRLALLLTLKTNAAFLAVTALVGTIAPQDLGRALQALGLPEKFCHLLLMTHRYLFVIQREFRRLLTAAEARGFKPRTNGHTYTTYAWLLGMLLVKSWDRAERVHQAMLCRGFNGRFHSLADFSYGARDAVFLTLAVLASAAVAGLPFLRGVS
ncbi:cobalt ECF transporter T component CbiQ [Desulfovibrio aminophilus]|nr:cobalt ECF transporter T component CbiQ [Desulfovibrio aminophilus]MCM0755872.1 cobalt ECF transporter T component CbiQ [Desulfovibrio aminophilus]